jgi:hypothetical protein
MTSQKNPSHRLTITLEVYADEANRVAPESIFEDLAAVVDRAYYWEADDASVESVLRITMWNGIDNPHPQDLPIRNRVVSECNVGGG